MTDPYRYRDANGNLLLDELLGPEHVRHYTRILSSSSADFREQQLAMERSLLEETAPPDAPGQEPWQPQPRGMMTPDGWLIAPEGSSQREASACTALAMMPQISWDVCGYYRRLGLPWPYVQVTVKQIRLAYLSADPRQEDGEMFYAMSQLVDPFIRRAYDLMPPGGLFMGDRGVRARIDQAAAREASRRNAAAAAAGEDYDEQEQTAGVLKEWGFERVDAGSDEARERLASPFRRGRAGDELGSSLSLWETDWGWFRMSDPYDDPWDEHPDWALLLRSAPEVLETWQASVAAALDSCGLRIRFSVGIWPGNGVKVWRDGNKSCIFFIGRGQHTQSMANEAARGVKAQMEHKGKRARLCLSCPQVWTRPSRSPRR